MEEQGFFEVLLTLLGGAAGGYGAYRRDVRIVGAGVVLLAFAIASIAFWAG